MVNKSWLNVVWKNLTVNYDFNRYYLSSCLIISQHFTSNSWERKTSPKYGKNGPKYRQKWAKIHIFVRVLEEIFSQPYEIWSNGLGWVESMCQTTFSHNMGTITSKMTKSPGHLPKSRFGRFFDLFFPQNDKNPHFGQQVLTKNVLSEKYSSRATKNIFTL